MNNAKLTPWYPREVKPARSGIYTISLAGLSAQKWSHFDGEHWNGAWSTRDSALEEAGFYRRNGHQGAIRAGGVRWRGLASDPSATGAAA